MRGSLWGAVMCAAAIGMSVAGCGDDDGPTPDDGGSTFDGGGREDAGSVPEDDGGAPPDAPADEPCESPGSVETVGCGMCGSVDRFCSIERVWVYSVCDEPAGACAPGTMRSASCGNCGAQAQRCTTACEWEDVGACSAEGECAPGTTTRATSGCPSGQTRELTCSDACAYAPTSACMADGCDTPGEHENVPCGRCGTQTRFCTAARVWSYDACSGEGECMPGTTGTTSCGMCGSRTTLCNTSCTWIPSGTCGGEGECTPGQTMRTPVGCSTPGHTRLVECSASCGYTIERAPCTATPPVDVLFLVDATGSNWFDFQGQRATFIARCVDPMLALADVQVGIAYYGDHGSSPQTFRAGVELGRSTSAAISTSVTTQTSFGGGDDSTMEALNILTGAAPQPGATPFTCSSGRVAGGCWRPTAQRVIVMHTDEYARGGPDPTSAGLWNPWPTGPNWTADVRARLLADGTILLIVLDDGYTPANALTQAHEMVRDLGQEVTDVHVQPSAGIGTTCDALLTRVRAVARL